MQTDEVGSSTPVAANQEMDEGVAVHTDEVGLSTPVAANKEMDEGVTVDNDKVSLSTPVAANQEMDERVTVHTDEVGSSTPTAANQERVSTAVNNEQSIIKFPVHYQQTKKLRQGKIFNIADNLCCIPFLCMTKHFYTILYQDTNIFFRAVTVDALINALMRY